MRTRPRRSRGVATLWVIVSLPAALCLLAIVIEVGNLYLARLEFLNALEAAALAGADAWGDGATQNIARNRAVELAAANTVNDQPVALAANFGNALCSDNIAAANNVVILGRVTGASPFSFHANPAALGDEAVRVQGTATINSVLAQVCGMTAGPFQVTGRATARYTGGSAQLIRVGAFTCP